MLKKILRKFKIFSDLDKIICNRKWRKKNSHNYTKMGNLFDRNSVEVGKGTYGTLNVNMYERNNGFLKIGSYCSIAPEVNFLLDGEHNYKLISTYPFKKRYLNKNETLSKGKITIDDDVWIGYGATILSGVHIGQGAIVGAKALVTKDIPPYAIVGGVPAKIIKYRFEQEIIEKLLKIDFNKLKYEENQSLELLYKEIDKGNVDEIIKGLEL